MEQFGKNMSYTIEITGITSEGNGVGRVDGFAVFVPDTAPGDICEIKLVKANKSFGYGRLEKLITPSKSRVTPDCSVFVPCGGCSYRHMSYEAELDVKQQLVFNSFKRLGGIDCAVSDIIGSENPDGYRNKAQYPLAYDSDGQVVSGFYAKRSHRVVPTEHCALQPDVFSHIKDTILEFVNLNKITVYDEVTGRGLLRHIYLRHGEATGQIMVCLVATAFTVPHIQQLIRRLIEQHKGIKSVVINRNRGNNNVILGNDCNVIYGTDTIEDILCGVNVVISPLSFYQVNRKQAEHLYEVAIDCADFTEEETLVDLYCGAGTIGLAAASKVKSLIGVEIVSSAVDNAIVNAKRNGITNARFICADVGKAIDDLLSEEVPVDVVIVDPPRKGLEEEVVSAIVKLQASRIVMVSCNPTTAARDCKLLVEQGYSVEKIVPVDMFPRTVHVETCILLKKV